MSKQKDRKKSLEKRLYQLGATEEMPALVQQTRKILTHFPHLLSLGCSYDEHLFQTLFLCETAISKCSVAERANCSVDEVLITVLEIMKLACVCKKVVISCLHTLHSIIHNLDRSEVMNMHDKIKSKLSYLSQFFCEMEHFAIMRAVVKILYEYVHKCASEDRRNVFLDVMEDFTDPSRNLGSIIHWTPESFTMNCRTFLNNIPERKYYSLAATSAAIGSNAICPLGGKNFISFEWNSNPAELSFEASLADNLNRSFEASIELNDIQSLTIVEDLYAPRVECSYEKIQITDDSIVTYDLNINALNNEELGVLAQLMKTMIHPEKLVYKPLRPAADEDEVLIRCEQLYNTKDITDNGPAVPPPPSPPLPSPQKENSVTSDAIARNETPDKTPTPECRTEPEPELEAPVVSAVPSVYNGDADTSNLSESKEFAPLSTAKWPFKLIDLSDDHKKAAPNSDPYDIAHLREEERTQKRTTNKNVKGAGKANGYSKKTEEPTNGTKTQSKKRPAYMKSSTPTKRTRATVMKTVPKDLEELSTIYCISDDTHSDADDSDFIPYAMLSGLGKSNRSKKQETMRKQSMPVARKMSGRARDVNVKQPAANNTLQPQKNPTSHGMKTNRGKENTLNKQPQLNDSGKQCLESREVKHPLGRKPAQESSYMNGRANSSSFNCSERIVGSESTARKSPTHCSSTVPRAVVLQETVASPLRSSNRNGDETIQMGMEVYENPVNADRTSTTTTPACTTVQTMIESKVQPLIVDLRRYNSERICTALNEAQALENTNCEEYNGIKEICARTKKLEAELEILYCKMMAMIRNSNEKETLNQKRMQAAQRDQEFIQKVRAEKKNLQTIFQACKVQYDQQHNGRVAQELWKVIYGPDASLTSPMLN
ncbi:uncharacterized protein LOC121596107 [Anopheles merus]|uniref:uncharacterized protein LOC121596107 n=1 Tax=Anopheles merus TaxID=30066 RepID=UPI001BE3DFEF|nr:uncharacterized protein LOC121596107 [Anopheles merus]